MTPADFIAKWSKVALSERASYQQHFLDLCALVGHETPAKADPTGDFFCFERGAEIHGGGDGWADVWKRGFFGIEYKGKHKDLGKAYDQLLKYRASLENPPLLVVCDTDKLEIHTNFTGTAEKVYGLSTAEIDNPRNLEVLRNLFFDPERLKPGITSAAVTQEAAGKLASLAQSLRNRGLAPQEVAKFLDRVVFALFAEDVQLLPSKVFTTIAEKAHDDPARFQKLCGQLFQAMATGGDFGPESIRYFNGDLFTNAPVLELTKQEIAEIRAACALDWGAVDASIFGTLFQRGLDPAMRAALGAEYTGREDIELLIEPVILRPLRGEWGVATKKILDLVIGKKGPSLKSALTKAEKIKHDFLDRLAKVHVMDPACGSGNFLYVALQKLKDLEKEVILFGGAEGVETSFFPKIGPWQFHGIEINGYAYELAQMTLWIGYLQWHRGNGFALTEDPLLKKLDTFYHHDALLDLTDPSNPKEWSWPIPAGCEVYIVGNPPFLGNKRIKSELGEAYFENVQKVFEDRLAPSSDFVCYWFEKARALVEAGMVRRAGLLAASAIKQVSSRHVLERIAESCRIYFAISDRDWLQDGASVRIAMIGFGAKEDTSACELDGMAVDQISATLRAGVDLMAKQTLSANLRQCFMGVTKVGDFDISQELAREWLLRPNPHGRPNSDVLRPFANGSDLVREPSNRWIIDFGVGTTLEDASLYEEPFRYLVEHVKQARAQNGRESYRLAWWQHGEPRPRFRKAVAGLQRYIGTARVAKHRLFVWLDTVVLPDSKVIAIADDSFERLGILQSGLHEAWTRATCGWHGIGNDATYNPTECYESFPFLVKLSERHREAIKAAMINLDNLRNEWLRPSSHMHAEFIEFPGSVGGPWDAYILKESIRQNGQGLVRYPVMNPLNLTAERIISERTLTKLYNANPEWLKTAHRRLDAAVFDAYGVPTDATEDAILAHLLKLNQASATKA